MFQAAVQNKDSPSLHHKLQVVPQALAFQHFTWSSGSCTPLGRADSQRNGLSEDKVSTSLKEKLRRGIYD